MPISPDFEQSMTEINNGASHAEAQPRIVEELLKKAEEDPVTYLIASLDMIQEEKTRGVLGLYEERERSVQEPKEKVPHLLSVADLKQAYLQVREQIDCWPTILGNDPEQQHRKDLELLHRLRLEGDFSMEDLSTVKAAMNKRKEERDSNNYPHTKICIEIAKQILEEVQKKQEDKRKTNPKYNTTCDKIEKIISDPALKFFKLHILTRAYQTLSQNFFGCVR